MLEIKKENFEFYKNSNDYCFIYKDNNLIIEGTVVIKSSDHGGELFEEIDYIELFEEDKEEYLETIEDILSSIDIDLIINAKELISS